MTEKDKPKVGVIFKSYEPMASQIAYAKQTEASGFTGGYWIAEAGYWFRNYGLELRGGMTTLAAVTMATKEIPIGVGITSPYIRHPGTLAAEAMALDELGGGRFILGLGVGKVGLTSFEYDLKEKPPVRVHKEAIEIIRNIFSGKEFSFEGEFYSADIPEFDRHAAGLRTDIPVYMGATGPYMQRLAGKVADGLLLPGLTSAGFVSYALDQFRTSSEQAGRMIPADYPVGGVILAACSKDGAKARDMARSYTATYVVNKLRNIKNDVILAKSGLPDEAFEPFRKAIAEGTEDNVTHLVSDEMMRAFAVIAGTPDECAEITQELMDAGMNTPLLEVVGFSEADNLESIRLYGEEVLPQLKG